MSKPEVIEDNSGTVRGKKNNLERTSLKRELLLFWVTPESEIIDLYTVKELKINKTKCVEVGQG